MSRFVNTSNYTTLGVISSVDGNTSAILAKVADSLLNEANSAYYSHFELEFYHLTFAGVD